MYQEWTNKDKVCIMGTMDNESNNLPNREEWIAQRDAFRQEVLSLKTQGLNSREIATQLDSTYERIRAVLQYARRKARNEN